MSDQLILAESGAHGVAQMADLESANVYTLDGGLDIDLFISQQGLINLLTSFVSRCDLLALCRFDNFGVESERVYFE